MALLPKTMRERALALLRRLTDGGYISWRPDTLELIVDGIEHKSTNLVDLVGHVAQQRRAEPMMHGSPGLPPGFAEFAAVLRRANASHELVRNRHRWPVIYSTRSDDDDSDDTEAEDVGENSEPSHDENTKKKKEKLWEEEAIESPRNEPLAMAEDDSDQEENYATPSCSDKQHQNPLLTGSRTNRSSLHGSRAIMNTTAGKTSNKKKLTTKPDLHQHYRRAGQAGSLAGVSKLWTALGRRPASKAIGKALAAEECYTLHWPVRYHFPRWQTIVSGLGEQLQCDLVDCSEYREVSDGTRYLFIPELYKRVN